MALRPSQGPGQYIKAFSTLTEDFSTANNFTPDKATLEKYLPVILKSCPNLKAIDVEGFEGHHVVYRAIIEERANGGCNALESIPSLDESGSDDVYWYGHAIWAIRDTLKHLSVFDYLVTPHFNFGAVDDSFAQLRPFTRLNKVQFYIHGVEPSLYEVFSAIRDCTSLEDLSVFETHHY